MVVDTAADALATRLRTLVSPFGGLVGSVRPLRCVPGSTDLRVSMASIGDPAQALSELAKWSRHTGRSLVGRADGAGGSVDVETANWLCVAEALERYAMMTYSPEQFIWATYDELGDDALDLSAVPRLSETEQAHPDCFLHDPALNAPIRWVRGLSLVTGRPIWLPAIMVYLTISYQSWGERFAMSISTGCAAHTDPVMAINKGLREVIERDSIALTWHQMLELPRITLDAVDPDLADYLDRCDRPFQEMHWFDATTDVGVPTVYAVHVTPNHPRIRTMVMCSTELDPAVAVRKILREVAAGRIGLERKGPPPQRADQCFELEDGALFTGSPHNAAAFDFLLDSRHTTPLSEMAPLTAATPEEELRLLVQKLAGVGMDAYVVDLTTDEAARVGFTVVRVLVPGLQPLSFASWGQFRAHPRLYRAPAAMGHAVRVEAELNPWPQPFA